MKPLLFLYILLGVWFTNAQGTISGKFSPAKDFKWLIAYELTPGGERYVTDTSIKEGTFTLTMPITAQPGMYRLVYAVPQDEFYIDIIYDKKEQITFNFSLDQGLNITNSKENKAYNDYFNAITEAQDQLMEYYENGNTSKEKFKTLTVNLNNVQKTYEEKFNGTIAHIFIKANRPYIPGQYESLELFLKHKKTHHFDHLNVNDKILQGSNFLTDKFSSYVFSALPLTINSAENLDQEVIKNIETTANFINATPISFQVKAMHQLWKIADVNAMSNVADYIFEHHLKKLAIANGNQSMVDEITMASRLRIGAISPDISWQKNGKTHSLSTMDKAENYLLVFWSSTCSHCLKELPALHKELKKFNGLKIIAVGLEDNDTNWKKVSATLPDFNHAIALGKWESEYAQTFGIQSTPTYIVLDNEKRIIAKPESDKELIDFLEN
ncbi:TlpA disulfide reductase family protein [Maribacter sp. MAR_2009_72]|uniref:TlpA disulfide reductase family protein n=1 Tax=Maribacter sp. MAR_2009_72 TaxID=1250050 RepID=UPI00119A9E15|nr:TlpA disulfide reductase family protein [Maribacter sp. MAR_2009_72]TVZ16474.1 thiol-disulfide isomerase/thioredoxin [Maribacter sp. MAR_2009_72]